MPVITNDTTIPKNRDSNHPLKRPTHARAVGKSMHSFKATFSIFQKFRLSSSNLPSSFILKRRRRKSRI